MANNNTELHLSHIPTYVYVILFYLYETHDTLNTYIYIYIYVLASELCWWIGLGDEDKDGSWKWVGTNREPTFKSWGENQPGKTGLCAVLNAKSGYDWYSERCSFDKCYPICEKEKV